MKRGTKRISVAPSPRLHRLYRMHDQINQDFFDGKLLRIRIKLEKRNVINYGTYEAFTRLSDEAYRLESAVIKIHTECFTDQKLLLGTLIHEMIHQWQAEIAKVPVDHGPEFEEKRREAEARYGVEV